MTVDGFGIHAKFVGSVHPDPATGQVAVHFDDLPQVPFDAFNVHLFASDRGLMATPTKCAVFATEAIFFPWNTVSPKSTRARSSASTRARTAVPAREKRARLRLVSLREPRTRWREPTPGSPFNWTEMTATNSSVT